MGKRVVIQPVSRIEGHAKITIELDGKGNAKWARFQVLELRGFERFTRGRPVEEMPRITARICGVCPWSHHMASAKAADAVFGAEIPAPAAKLREMVYSLYLADDHLLHFYYLAAPDFIMGPGADYRVRNIFGIIKKMPDVARKVVHARMAARRCLELMAGRMVHPVWACPGGVSKGLRGGEKDVFESATQEMLDVALFSMKFMKEEIAPEFMDDIKHLGDIKTSYLGTVKDDGALELYDGRLRMMAPDGEYEDFSPQDYLEYIREKAVPWSYPKFTYYRKMGDVSLDESDPKGTYRVNCLARLNVADCIPTPLAQEELKVFRKEFGRPAHQSLLYNWARLVETIYALENVQRLLEDPDITSSDVRVPVKPRAARGVGSVEAPRGTLIHDYETDEEGRMLRANLLVATTQNQAAINMAISRTAREHIRGGEYDEELLNKLEMIVRAYDPCLSCATHRIDGKMPLVVEILGEDGKLQETLRNWNA